MGQFSKGDKVYFNCKSDSSYSGEYVVESEFSPDNFQWYLNSNNKPYHGELYVLRGLTDKIIAGSSLSKVEDK